MRWTPILFLAACTLGGKPFSPFGNSGGGTPPGTNGDAPAAGAVAAASASSSARCPNGKKYFLGAAEEYPGQGATTVALADVNGDGKLDIVTGNPNHRPRPKPHIDSVATMLNKGGGTFAEMVFSPVAFDRPGEVGYPELIAAGDLDGDGHPDIVFSSPNTGLTDPLYAIGNGDGTFADTISLHANSDGGDVIIADLNGDQKNDVVIHDLVWLNGGTKGHAKFPGKVPLDRVEDESRAMTEAVADFNGDGALDLLAKYQGAVIYTNDGNGAFTKGARFPVDETRDVAAGDLDGDGKADILVLAKESLAIIMNKGGGKFAAPVYVKLPEFMEPMFVTATDLNGDGKADLVIPGSDYVGVLMNDGTGKLTAPIKVAAGKPYKVVAGDLTGDHVQSLVVVNSASGGEDKSKLYVVRASCR